MFLLPRLRMLLLLLPAASALHGTLASFLALLPLALLASLWFRSLLPLPLGLIGGGWAGGVGGSLAVLVGCARVLWAVGWGLADGMGGCLCRWWLHYAGNSSSSSSARGMDTAAAASCGVAVACSGRLGETRNSGSGGVLSVRASAPCIIRGILLSIRMYSGQYYYFYILP